MKQFGYHATLDWYDQNAQHYAQKSKQHSTIDEKQLLEFISHLKSGAKILDAGSGAGRDTYKLQQLGFSVVGVDISHGLISQAQQSYPDCTFVIGDLLKLQFPDQEFDGVWAHASLVHFDKPQQITQAVAEIVRVLKSDGILHLLVRAKKIQRTEIKVDAISGHERFYWNFDLEEVKNLLIDHGFSIIKLIRYKESDLDPQKRPEDAVEWILVLAKKTSQQ